MAPPNTLPTRRLGRDGPEVSAIGFGLMGLSVAYGTTGTEEERLAVLDRAWELGCTFWDSADAYGDSEDLVGRWLARHPGRRADLVLATKFGLVPDGAGAGGISIDSSPARCRQQCEASLRRLGVAAVDLYYIHRLDDTTPVERTMEALVQLKSEGKIKHLGLSECSAAALRRAHAVHPVAAVQVEYNPWDLDVEGPASGGLLAACRELGVAVVAYSPLGRGLLTGAVRSRADLAPDDYRRLLGRWSDENFARNLAVVERVAEMAARKGATPGQLALAWLLRQGGDVIPIPGTKKIKYLEENVAGVKVELTDEEEKEIRDVVNEANVVGGRVPDGGPQYADSPPL